MFYSYGYSLRRKLFENVREWTSSMTENCTLAGKHHIIHKTEKNLHYIYQHLTTQKGYKPMHLPQPCVHSSLYCDFTTMTLPRKSAHTLPVSYGKYVRGQIIQRLPLVHGRVLGIIDLEEVVRIDSDQDGPSVGVYRFGQESCF